MNEVKGDRHNLADFAYCGSDAGYKWVEPKEEEVSALYLDSNFEKAFKIDDISSVFHYELVAENGGLHSFMTEEKRGEIICNDGMLHEGEITNLPLAFGISHGIEDRYLDVDFAKKVPDLDCEFCDEVGCVERSDIHSAGTSHAEVDEEVEVSASSVLVPQCFNDQFENKNTVEMHGDTRVKRRNGWSFEDKMGSNSSVACEIPNFQESSDDQNTLEISSTFGLDGTKTDFSLPSVEAPCTSIHAYDESSPVSPCTEVQDSSVDDLSADSCAETIMVRARQRRLCRPPQRYLDGSQWLVSRVQRAKNHPTSLLKDKDLGVKTQKKHHRKALEIKASRNRAKKLDCGSDEEYEPLMSCLKTRKFKKRIDRRKFCQPWTLDEVVSLVDGMSKFGVGQWTDVKRNFFLCSRRTATDIRDKWRNLVKTNCRSSKRRENDKHLRSGSLLPKPVIERVRELADASVSMPGVKRGRKHSR